MEQEEKTGPDMERIGLFKEMGYLEESIPISNIVFNDSATKGKQMMTACTKSRNATQDGYFDSTFPRVFEGEAYADPIRSRRLYRLQQAKLNRDQLFKYTSPTKKPCGKGTYYGTFVENLPREYFSSRPRDAIPEPPPKKNFLTNPAKKGTGYGYADVTINKFPPYFLEEELEELQGSSQEPPSRPEPRPFQPYKAGLFQQDYFDPNPYGATGEEEETEEADEPEVESESGERKKPFLPAGPPKKDGGMKDGCLNKFPEYEGEPYLKPSLVRRGGEHYVNKENKMFRPVPGPKPYPVKSIIAKNVERKVTPQNFNSIKGVVYCKNGRKR